MMIVDPVIRMYTHHTDLEDRFKFINLVFNLIIEHSNNWILIIS